MGFLGLLGFLGVFGYMFGGSGSGSGDVVVWGGIFGFLGFLGFFGLFGFGGVFVVSKLFFILLNEFVVFLVRIRYCCVKLFVKKFI